MTITSTIPNDHSAACGETESDDRLEARVLPQEHITATVVDRMYRLYAESYTDTDETRYLYELVASHPRSLGKPEVLRRYLEHFDYRLDEAELEAIDRFRRLLAEYEIEPSPVRA